MQYPKVYLAIDNVAASKRWTSPNDWMELMRNSGVRYVEASADNECDPLYTLPSYIKEWLAEVKLSCAGNGMAIANLFSGHGTYATIGLSHTDDGIREHILNNWLKPYIRMAAELDAGTGFFCHAFPQRTVQSASGYAAEIRKLEDAVVQASEYAASIKGKPISLEQMYSPHQYPWTIESSLGLIGNTGVYITLDTGHQVGQKKYRRPSSDELWASCEPGGRELWAGTDYSAGLLKKARSGGMSPKEAIKRVEEDMNANPQLFSAERDSDLYAWVRELGCYSPIFHLQQTDGNVSGHWAFTEENNNKGVVEAGLLLKALKQSYDRTERAGMPARSREITLTLELFYNSAEYPFRIRSELAQSVAYWRKFVPEDGMSLDRLPCLLQGEDLE